MAQTEQLNIVVSEKGSKGVVALLKSIAAEARSAGGAVKTLRAQVNGKGGGKGGSGDGGVAVAEAAARKKIQIQRNSLSLDDRITARGIANQERLNNEFFKGQRFKLGLMKKDSDLSADLERKKIQMQRSSLTLDERIQKKILANRERVERRKIQMQRSSLTLDERIQKRALANRERAEARKIQMQRSSLTLDERIQKKILANRERVERRKIQLQRASLTLEQRQAAQKVAAQKRVNNEFFKGQRFKLKIMRTSDADQAKREAAAHRKAAAAARSHNKALRGLSGSVAKTSGGMRTLGNQVFFAQRAFAALGGAFAIRGYLQMSDTFQNMENRIRLVTEGTEHFNKVQKELQAISKSTRQSLGATTETYVRIRRATLDLGVADEEVMAVLKTLNQMLAVSGATATESEGAIRQLSQAFSKGKLDGDEFRSVGENLPDILTILQKSLGVTEGKLRDMAEAGQITKQVMLDAFKKGQGQAAKNFAGAIVTVGSAWQRLRDEVLLAVGEFNKSTGAIDKIVAGLMWLSENLWILKGILLILATVAFVMLIRAAHKLYLKLSIDLAFAVLGLGVDIQLRLIPWIIATATAMQASAVAAGGYTAALLAMLALPIAATIGVVVLALGTLAAVYYTTKSATEELSDSMAGIDWQDNFTGSMESQLIILIAKEVELKEAMEARAKIYKKGPGVVQGGGKAVFFKDLEDLNKQLKELEGSINVLSNQRDLEENREAMEAHAVALEEARIAQVKYNLEQDKMANKLKDMVGKQRPVVAAQQAMNKALKEFTVLATLADLSESQILGGREEIRDSSKDQRKPGEKAIRELQAKVDIQQVTNKKVRTELELRQKITEEMIKERGLRATEKIGVVNTVDGADASRKDDFKDEALNVEFKERLRLERELARLLGRSSSKTDKLGDAYQKLLDKLFPVQAAERELAKTEVMLEAIRKRGTITLERKNDLLARVKESMMAQLDPMGHLIKMEEQAAKFAGMSADARERGLMVSQLELEMKKKLGKAKLSGTDKADILEIASLRLSTVLINAKRDSSDALIKSLEKRFAVGATMAELEAGIQTIKESNLSATQKEIAIIEATAASYGSLGGIVKTVLNGYAGLTASQVKRADILKQLNVAEDLATQAYANGTFTLKQYTDALNLIIVPLQEFERKQAEIARKSTERHKKAMAEADEKVLKAQQELDALIRSQESINGLREMFSDGSITGMEQAFFASAFTGVEDQLISLAQTGKASWKDMTDSMIADLARIAARKAISGLFDLGGQNKASVEEARATLAVALAAAKEAEAAAALASIAAAKAVAAAASIGASGGGGGQSNSDAAGFLSLTAAFARHGATWNSANLPHFANGGSMQVGGQGGPDTKLVQFMASPGENVNVTNPGQSRLDNRPAPAAAPQVHITNVVDPAEMASAMATPAGRRAIINVIEQEGSSLAKFLK